MGQLSIAKPTKEWTSVGTFDGVTAAARRIRELEGRESGGIFLWLHVEIDFDEDWFSVLHHTGRRALYLIRRRAN